MKTHFDCVPCMINSLINLYKQGLIEEEYQETALKEVLKYYQDLDFSQTPLLVNRNLHQKIREVSNNKDPYKFLKDKYNNIALELYDKYKKIILSDKILLIKL